MTQLVSAWLASLEGVVAKLQRGAKVADVGCGVGGSTIRIAQAFPRARLFGYDAHPSAIEIARERASEAGVADRVTFDLASTTEFPGRQYDLVCHFGCLHAMPDPIGSAQHVRDALASGGTWMIVDTFAAGERLRNILAEAGFTRIRRAMETPLDLVLEARI
jgi:cyclopropane fatty-acyl-phospholipid synthase-like methyltransferase